MLWKTAPDWDWGAQNTTASIAITTDTATIKTKRTFSTGKKRMWLAAWLRIIEGAVQKNEKARGISVKFFEQGWNGIGNNS